jgi:hypothetical protein
MMLQTSHQKEASNVNHFFINFTALIFVFHERQIVSKVERKSHIGIVGHVLDWVALLWIRDLFDFAQFDQASKWSKRSSSWFVARGNVSFFTINYFIVV